MALAAWQEFAAELAQSLAWPLVALFAIVLFRSAIERLLGRIKSAKWGDKQLEFELKKLEETAKDVAPRKSATFANLNATERDGLLKLAKEHPRAAIVESWVRLEESLKTAARRVGGIPDTRRPIHSAVTILKDRSNLHANFFHVVEEMRQIRNKAVHEMDMASSLADATSYVKTAAALADVASQAGQT